MISITLENNQILDQKDGHIFVVNNSDSFKDLIRNIEDNQLLTNVPLNLLKAIAYSITSSKKFVTVLEIETKLNKTRMSIYKTIKELGTLGLLVNESFEITNYKSHLPKTKCFIEIDISDHIRLLESLENTKKIKKKNKSQKNLAQIRKQALTIEGLPTDIPKSSITKGLLASNSPPFELMLPYTNQGKKNHISTVYINQKKVMVEASSNKQLMTVEDLQTLHVLQTLSINYQANLMDYYVSTNTTPINKHPIEIIDIMRVLGKTSAGNYYKTFVKSIERIKSTSFDLHQLESVFLEQFKDDFFVRSDFRFFEKCTAISKDVAEIQMDEEGVSRVETKAIAYIITWNSDLFTKMLTDKYFFVIPLKILGAQPIIFLLYLHLRKAFSVNNKLRIDYTIQKLHKKIGNQSLLHNFRRDLTRYLKSWVESEMEFPSEGNIKIEFEGFNLYAVIEKKTVSGMSVTCDQQKMLQNLGIETDKNGKLDDGSKAAPTLANPINDLSSIIDFKEKRGEEFPQELKMRLLLNSGNSTKDFKIIKRKTELYIENKKNNWIVTPYCSTESIQNICEAIYDEKSNQASFFIHLTSQQKKLKLLGSSEEDNTNEVISHSVFNEIKNDFAENKGCFIQTDELYLLLKSKWQLRKQLLENSNRDIILDALVRSYLNEATRSEQTVLDI